MANNKTKKIRHGKEKKIIKYPFKKLPRIFKKAYTEKKFAKEIDKRLLIVSDKNFIVPLFVKDEKKIYRISVETEFTKKEIKRLKGIAKQIKMQKKWRINIIPLAAALCTVSAVIFGIFLFKDIAVKRAITSGMEELFKAKCDISSVSVDIFSSRIYIEKLSQADQKNTYMNIFEIDTIDIDFDLVQLLKKKFVADNIEFSGISVKTTREKDGSLPVKEKKSKDESPKTESVETDRSKSSPAVFFSSENPFTPDKITKIFEQYDSEQLIDSIYASLKSPALAQHVQNEVSSIIPRWESIPNDFQVLSKKLVNEGQTLLSIDIQSLKTQPEKIPDVVSSLTDAYILAKEAQVKAEVTINLMQQEIASVNKLEKSIQDAVTSDMGLVKNEINNIMSFNLDDAKSIVTDGIDAYLRDLLGTYYPYFVTGVDTARSYMTAKKTTEPPSKTAEEKTTRRGRIIEYKKDTVPSVLVKNIHVSGGKGVFTVEGTVKDFSSDMQKWGKPLTAGFVVSNGKLDNNISLIFDLREDSGGLLNAEYTGTGIAVKTSMPELEDIPGLPVISGNAKVYTKLLYNSKDSFELTGNANLKPAIIRASSFKPDFIFDIYQDALSQFNAIDAGFTAQLRGQSNFSFAVESSIDEQFSIILSNFINKKLKEIKDTALAAAQTYLNETLNTKIPAIDDFNSITASIQTEYIKISEFRENLEKKITEVREHLTGYAEDYVLTQLNSVTSQFDSTVNDAKTAAEKAKQEALAKAKAEAELLKKEAEAEKERLLKEAEAEAAAAARKAAQDAAAKAQDFIPKLW